MHSLQNGTQTAEKPKANNPLGDPGYFTESGADGRPSIPGADHFNAQIEEFRNVLLAGGVVFEPSKYDHFQRAIAAQIAVSMQDINKHQLALRVGEIWESHHPDSVLGWIDLKGGTLSRTTDKLLWDYAVAAGMTVSQATKDADPGAHAMKFGDGDGATTFTLPNHHLGHFVRGNPSGVSHGSTQTDAIRNITGVIDRISETFGNEGQVSGCFSKRTGFSSIRTPVNTDASEAGSLTLDASLVVPVADENRPYTANLLIKIHRGWMKIAYHYDYKTLIYLGESQIHKVAGYDEYILPQFSTWVAKPDFDEENEQAKFDVKNQKWLIELKPVEVTAYNKQTRDSKVFDDASLVTDEYTPEKPLTQWDEWINGSWVTNESNQHIAAYDQVDDKRRALYSQMCDPLKLEAMDLMDEGKEAEALQLKQQALAAKQKIKTENPWPLPSQS